MRMGGKVPESHVLVDKIVKLQKTLARKQEKIEFMEEHVSTMLEEMKKKNKLIQNYILKVESGALVSSQMDENKVSEKYKKFASLTTEVWIFAKHVKSVLIFRYQPEDLGCN